MSEEIERRIPRYGHAKVAFLGVEVNDTYLLVVSVFIGLFAGSKLGLVGYVGIPVIGYFLNKIWLDWKSDQLPGNFANYMYQHGLIAYSSAFKSADVVYHGDSQIRNRGILRQMSQLQTEHKKDEVSEDGN